MDQSNEAAAIRGATDSKTTDDALILPLSTCDLPPFVTGENIVRALIVLRQMAMAKSEQPNAIDALDTAFRVPMEVSNARHIIAPQNGAFLRGRS